MILITNQSGALQIIKHRCSHFPTQLPVCSQQSTVSDNRPVQTCKFFMSFLFQSFYWCYPALAVSKAREAVRGPCPPGVYNQTLKEGSTLYSETKAKKCVCLGVCTTGAREDWGLWFISSEANFDFQYGELLEGVRTEICVCQEGQLCTSGKRARCTWALVAPKTQDRATAWVTPAAASQAVGKPVTDKAGRIYACPAGSYSEDLKLKISAVW